MACIGLLRIALPLTAKALHARWLFVAAFGLFALSLTAIQRWFVAAAVRRRVAAEAGGRMVLVAGELLGVVAGGGCLVFAWRLWTS